MEAALVILAGFLLDQLLGDPPGWPHPVRGLGRLIEALEPPLRRLFPERLGGILLLVLVTATSGGLAWAVLLLADWIDPWARLGVEALLVYLGLAARSLAAETEAVLQACAAENWEEARLRLSRIVGRDTNDLPPEEIYRACIETVAENTSDGVVAPLCFAALLGPVGLWVCKAISTLDSMVGYRNEKYRWFGWASARADDVANYLPARLTWLLLALACVLTRQRGRQSLRIGWRDGRKHPSPNAAWSEAAMAGALAVQLGGASTYQGVLSQKPTLGDPGEPLTIEKVRQAIGLMQATALLALGLALVVAPAASSLWLPSTPRSDAPILDSSLTVSGTQRTRIGSVVMTHPKRGTAMSARVQVLGVGAMLLSGILAAPAADAPPEALRKALVFHASFDGQADADFARGDKRIWTAPAFNRKDAKPGLHRADVEIAKGKGKYGDALRFGKNDKAVIFYQADKNMAYREKGWSGAVSFWLSLDPDKDLEPGYCDPIQITDKKWDDSAFFVDFTKDDKPRHFRLGIYSDFKIWNPKGLKFEQVPVADRPLSEEIAKPPFARDRWTHVCFTFANLNSGKADGAGKLYLDGKPAASIQKRELTLTWDPTKAAIMLGLSYIGLYDDLAIFDRALSDEEVLAVHRLEGGVAALRK